MLVAASLGSYWQSKDNDWQEEHFGRCPSHLPHETLVSTWSATPQSPPMQTGPTHTWTCVRGRHCTRGQHVVACRRELPAQCRRPPAVTWLCSQARGVGMGGRRVTLWRNNRSGAADGGEVSDAGGLGDVLGNLIHQFRNAYPALPRWQYPAGDRQR